jgi:uncharacterized membrane protein YgcG
MSILERVVGLSMPRSMKQILACLLLPTLLSPAWPQDLPAGQALPAPTQAAPRPTYPQQTPEQLQQLVAPIALYPDSLVAQILAASTFPEQVVEADRWVQAHPDLKGDALGHAVDQQPWDPSVKALTAFPSVLGNMDKNLSWTSSLGDAYYNQQPEVMDAIQLMRRRAQQAGNLNITSQQTVETQGSTIVIQPAAPEVVYVPAYDPWVVYGDPIVAWPGWYPYPGIWYDGPYLSWGIGFEIGWFWGWGWGWGHWGFDWHHRYATYDHDRYYSHSRTFYNRDHFYRGGGDRAGGERGGDRGGERGGGDRGGGGRGGVERGGGFDRSGAAARPFNGDTRAARGYAEPRGQSGVRSGAFSGSERGGEARGYSSRGSSSVGGGGFGRGGGGFGGGGFGGGHGGGGHR